MPTLSTVESAQGKNAWAKIEAELRPLLQSLWAAPSAPRLEHVEPIPKEAGVYLFTAAGKPIYVGQTRNLRRRLADHCRPSSGHNKASFAFLRAKKLYEAKQNENYAGTRAALEVAESFPQLFDEAKTDVARMDVRFTTCCDAELRTVFEVYAAELLDTKEFNIFETH